MTINSSVVVTLQVEGIHHWPQCPLKDVAFLRAPHRHVFHVKARKAVTHDDRDVEIIMLKRKITAYFGIVNDFGSRSCEMLAKELIEHFDLLDCEVLEDGENGAYLWRSV